ncbi:hypothetical protein K431DRAFT_287191 [Polychaeton citri CBS 116435]|uniref:ceramidase n=1 Tax=Polychaeton citri CBS 116435 TaxID=1314669 RepID=A0A9P4Q3S5_9PEZI|nr:hypothetical protein K431DRAFT_287191 [Polychaeton citri CBS 116435]
MPPKTRSQSLQEDAPASYSHPGGDASSESAASVRHRHGPVQEQAMKKKASDKPTEPPTFAIDLSLPPEERYLEVCAAFKDEMRGLTSLFDEVVGGITQVIPEWLFKRICSLMLRKVYDGEENAELKGISKATGVEMYLLVCFNVLLDLFMGCSSGGARIRADTAGGTKMVHFRTLDWGMPALRRVVVQLEYKLCSDGPIIARSITYAGFVGVLTGVKEGLSMSLNFRPTHDNSSSFRSNSRYYGHLVLVLLGLRRSISSNLRSLLLPRSESNSVLNLLRHSKKREVQLDYNNALNAVGGRTPYTTRPLTTTACYLCFSNATETTVVEKDRASARSRSDKKFIVVTNTDFSPADLKDPSSHAPRTKEVDKANFTAILDELAEEAQDRKQCAEQNWKRMRKANLASKPPGSNAKEAMGLEDVIEMVQKFPTTNECTHYACVMDPSDGTIKWCRKWDKPVGAKWIRAHMSEGW